MSMSFFAIYVIILTIFLVMVVFWIWLCAGILRSEESWRYTAGAIALQFSIAVLFAALLMSDDLFFALSSAAMPVIWIAFGFLHYYPKFYLFLNQVVPLALILSLPILLLFRSILRLKVWSLAPALMALLIAATLVGEHISQKTMCRTAKVAGIDVFARRSVLASLEIIGQEPQFDIHALAEVGEKRWGWSYREMDWYVIPPRAWGEVEAPMFDCSTVNDFFSLK